MNHIAVIIVAGGSSTRMKGIDKLNIKLDDGKTVLQHSVSVFVGLADRILVVGKDGEVPGGKERSDSVQNGLEALSKENYDFILIHDAARPFVSRKIIKNVIDALDNGADAVVPCVRPKDTIRTKSDTLKRDELFAVQTPQGFKSKVIYEAYKKAKAENFFGTDDISVSEFAGYKTCIVEGDYKNIKITTRDDLPKENRIRVGQGYDLHKLVEGRKLMLGCVEIPFEKGLLGHSDADVIAHAICDALLGAAALGDIGKHFPDTSKETEGMSGKEILKKTKAIIQNAGYSIKNVDATLLAQRPKISPYTVKMQEEIAKALGIDPCVVSVKASTTEGCKEVGAGLCMECLAIASIEQK